LRQLSRYERWNRLLELVAERGHLEVADAARTLDVSEATIRRDLDQLAQQRMLTRTRGGATGSTQLAHELPLLYKTARHAHEKQRIGRAAAALVRPGATVVLNGGTTTIEVARALASRSLAGRSHPARAQPADMNGPADKAGPAVTVVTNALSIANELVIRPQVKLVVTGGVARSESTELIGPLATYLLNDLTFDWAILGVDGVDAVAGASAHHEGEASINRLMAQRAQRVAIVADSSKIGRPAFARVCGVSEIDVLVTDAAPETPAVLSLAERGVRIIAA
jgi:DeoR family transcriptional regulator of aga operon